MRVWIGNLVTGDMIRVEQHRFPALVQGIWNHDNCIVLKVTKTNFGLYDVTLLTSKSHILTEKCGNVSFELTVPIMWGDVPIANQYTRMYG